MYDASFSLERTGDYVGHSSAYMTDAYRHLLEGHEAEAAERFEDYLTRAVRSTPPFESEHRIRRDVGQRGHSAYCRPASRSHPEGR